jgi:hypothetical protein
MSDSVTPSEQLAALTVDRLIQSGLLRADKRDALIAKIAAGSMKGEDWKNEIDLASLKAAS